MSVSTVPPAEHLHPDDQTLAEYSAVSRPAILALGLGVASGLMLVSPLLVLIPLAATAAAIVALRSISASGGQLTGRWPATVGMCLAVLFLGWGFSRHWTRQTTLVDHAERFAEGWLRICQEGKLQRADQLMRAPSARIHSDEGIAEFYRTNKEADAEVESFFAKEPMKRFLALGKESQFDLSIVGQTHTGFTDEIVFRCDCWPAEGASQVEPFWISVFRASEPGSAAPDWRINSIEDSEPRSVR